MVLCWLYHCRWPSWNWAHCTPVAAAQAELCLTTTGATGNMRALARCHFLFFRFWAVINVCWHCLWARSLNAIPWGEQQKAFFSRIQHWDWMLSSEWMVLVPHRTEEQAHSGWIGFSSWCALVDPLRGWAKSLWIKASSFMQALCEWCWCNLVREPWS